MLWPILIDLSPVSRAMNYHFTEGVKLREHVEKARQAQGLTDDFPVPVGPMTLKGAASVSIQSANNFQTHPIMIFEGCESPLTSEPSEPLRAMI